MKKPDAYLQWHLHSPPGDGTEDRKDGLEVLRPAHLEYTACDKREPTSTRWERRDNCPMLSSDVHVCAMAPTLTHMHTPHIHNRLPLIKKHKIYLYYKKTSLIRRKENKTLHLEGRGGRREVGKRNLEAILRSRDLQANVLKGT